MRTVLKISVLFLALSVVSCADGINEGENYGDLLSSPEGLILTPEEHAGGWGRPNCFFCHPFENLHLANITSFPDIDMEAVRLQTATEGEASCASCHGTNGVY